MKFDDDDIIIPDNTYDFLKMLEELAKQVSEVLSMTKEEYEEKYGVSPSTPPSPHSVKTRGCKSKIVVPAYDMHTFDMHWMLHYLDLFRGGISLKEYVRRARREGSDITIKWYNIVEKYVLPKRAFNEWDGKNSDTKAGNCLNNLTYT